LDTLANSNPLTSKFFYQPFVKQILKEKELTMKKEAELCLDNRALKRRILISIGSDNKLVFHRVENEEENVINILALDFVKNKIEERRRLEEEKNCVKKK